MNRRTFMMTGACLPTIAADVWPALARAASQSGTLAIVDHSLPSGPAFARYAAQMNLPVFEAGGDIGALWYTTLAPRLPPMSSLIGLTRASDYFVLHVLATRAGLHATSAAQHAGAAFTFTPQIRHRDGT